MNLLRRKARLVQQVNQIQLQERSRTDEVVDIPPSEVPAIVVGDQDISGVPHHEQQSRSWEQISNLRKPQGMSGRFLAPYFRVALMSICLTNLFQNSSGRSNVSRLPGRLTRHNPGKRDT